MNNRNWKEKDELYIFYLQKFLDTCDNIDNKELKDRIIKNMILCDERLTILAEEQINSIKNERK